MRTECKQKAQEFFIVCKTGAQCSLRFTQSPAQRGAALFFAHALRAVAFGAALGFASALLFALALALPHFARVFAGVLARLLAFALAFALAAEAGLRTHFDCRCTGGDFSLSLRSVGWASGLGCSTCGVSNSGDKTSKAEGDSQVRSIAIAASPKSSPSCRIWRITVVDHG